MRMYVRGQSTEIHIHGVEKELFQQLQQMTGKPVKDFMGLRWIPLTVYGPISKILFYENDTVSMKPIPEGVNL